MTTSRTLQEVDRRVDVLLGRIGALEQENIRLRERIDASVGGQKAEFWQPRSDYDQQDFLLHDGSRSGATNQDQKFINDVRALRGLWIGADSDPEDGCLHIENFINKSTAHACHILKSSNQATSTGSLATVTWTDSGERFDTNNLFTQSVSTTNIYAPVDGVYLCGAYVSWGTHASNSLILVRIDCSSASPTYIAFERVPMVNSITSTCSTVGCAYMSQGDYFQIRAQQSTGGNLDIVASTTGVWVVRIA